MADLIYLDYNCFQRGFDDLEQTRIKMEALACQEIFTKAETNEVILVWSFMHQDETLLCPFPQRKYAVLNMANICQVKVPPKLEIVELAKSFQKQVNVSSKDAIHLAAAEYVKASFFLTCDDNLIKQGIKLSLQTEILNPIDYVRREINS
jgi:predicted nucleic acid-binding protein